MTPRHHLVAPEHRLTLRPPAPPFPSFHLNAAAPYQLFPVWLISNQWWLGKVLCRPMRSENPSRDLPMTSGLVLGLHGAEERGEKSVGSFWKRKWGDAFWRSGSGSSSIIVWVTAAENSGVLSGNVKVRTSEAVCLGTEITMIHWVKSLADGNRVKALQGWAESLSVAVYTLCDITGAVWPWM